MIDLPPLGNAPLKQAPPVEAQVDGFQAAAGAAGIRNDGREDLALIDAGKPVPTAAVFTQNRVMAAPVVISRKHAASGMIRAIVANSGCANAATGQPGLDAALASCEQVAKVLGCRPQEVLPCSTGVIGQFLDTDKIAACLPAMKEALSPEGLPQAAFAIKTTDSFTKMARSDCEIDGVAVRVVGIAKGAGMIRPDMATMLSFMMTDAAATPAALDQVLRGAVGEGFNRISVDGDTSTNDTAVLMASGASGAPELDLGAAGLQSLQRAVTEVCQSLAAMMVADGEGASHLIRVRITGAEDARTARIFCYAVAHSLLCKTAFAGCDPNWGRLISTAGAEASRQEIDLDPERLKLWIGGNLISESGLWGGAEAEEQAAQAMKKDRYEIHMDLGMGTGEFWILTSDLTHEYVNINADYRS